MSYTVTDPNDTLNFGTLRFAIQAQEPDITIQAGLSVILDSTLPITYPVTISADPINRASISASADMILLDISAPFSLTGVNLLGFGTDTLAINIANTSIFLTDCDFSGFIVSSLDAPCINMVCTQLGAGFPTYDLSLIRVRMLNNENQYIGFSTGSPIHVAINNDNNLRITLVACIFENNISQQRGIYVDTGNNSLTNPRTCDISIYDCQFRNNRAGIGGASLFLLLQSLVTTTLVIVDSIFDNNRINFGQAGGAAIFIRQNNSGVSSFLSPSLAASFTRTKFLNNGSNNFTLVNGGAVGHVIESIIPGREIFTSVDFTDCVFLDNGSQMNNGGAYSLNAAGRIIGNVPAINFTRCVLARNNVNNQGGAIYASIDSGSLNLNLLNSTFNENLSNQGGALYLQSTNMSVMNTIGNSLTIYGNSGTGIHQETTNINNCSLNNTIIAGNVPSNRTGSTRSFYQENTCINDVIDLNLQALADNGGNTLTMAIDETSSAFNTGNNSIVTTTVDQRGYPRIAYGIVDVGAYEYQEPLIVCFTGDARVLTLVGTVLARDLKPKALVYDVLHKRYVSVISVIKTEATHLVRLEPDLLITPGHLVLYNNKPTKAKDMPGAIAVTGKPQTVYTVITEEAVPIDVNGLGVYTWSLRKWSRKAKQGRVQK